MANHKQAIKRHRQSIKRSERNTHYRRTVRTFIKRARLALAGGEGSSATQAVRDATKMIDKIASRGVIPKERASRLKSRLMTQLAALG